VVVVVADIRAFAVAEWEKSHQLLDALQVPRFGDKGELLSVSERIELLTRRTN
jgi:hypothetical protein